MFPGGTRVICLRTLQRRQTAPVKRKTDKCDKRKTDKCDFIFFYRQGWNAKHERKFNRLPINGLGELCLFAVISPRGPDRMFLMYGWHSISSSIDMTPFTVDTTHGSCRLRSVWPSIQLRPSDFKIKWPFLELASNEYDNQLPFLQVLLWHCLDEQ